MNDYWNRQSSDRVKKSSFKRKIELRVQDNETKNILVASAIVQPNIRTILHDKLNVILDRLLLAEE